MIAKSDKQKHRGTIMNKRGLNETQEVSSDEDFEALEPVKKSDDLFNALESSTTIMGAVGASDVNILQSEASVFENVDKFGAKVESDSESDEMTAV